MSDTDLRDLLDDAADDHGRVPLSGPALAARARGVRRRRRALLAGAVATTAAATVLVALVVGRPPSSGPVMGAVPTSAVPTADTARADRAALLASVGGAEGGGFERPYDDLAGMLPGVDSIVVGRVVGVEPGVGFDDPDADWRWLEVTVRVESTLKGVDAPPLVLDWSLGSTADTDPDDVDAVARGLRDLGRVLLLTRALPDDPAYGGLTRILADPTVSVAQVDDADRLDLVLMEAGEAGTTPAEFLGDLDTLDAVRTELMR